MTSDASLLQRFVQAGDREALGELFAKHYAAIHRSVLHMVHDSFEASDLTQAVFLKAIRAGHSFEPVGSFRAWLLKIAVNEVRQFRRGEHRRHRRDEIFQMYCAESATDQVAEDAVRREFEQRLDTELTLMPPELKDPLVLHYFEGSSYAQISEVLELPKSTVQRRLQRAVNHLRDRFRSSGATALLPFLDRLAPATGGTGLAVLAPALFGVAAMKVSYKLIASFVLLASCVVAAILVWAGQSEATRGVAATGDRVIADADTELTRAERLVRDAADDRHRVHSPQKARVYGRVVAGVEREGAARPQDRAVGAGLSGARVEVYDYAQGAMHVAIADERGFFEVAESVGSTGSFHVSATKPGFGRTRLDAVLPSIRPLEVLMKPARVLRGRILAAATRDPVCEFRVAVIRNHGRRMGLQVVAAMRRESLPPSARVECDRLFETHDGSFEIEDLDEGKYSLLVSARGFAPMVFSGGYPSWDHDHGLIAAAPDRAKRFDVLLPRTRETRMRVVDARTGLGLEGAQIRVELEGCGQHFYWPPGVVAERDGLYRLSLACDERGRLATSYLRVYKPGYVAWRGAVHRDDTIRVVELGSGASIRGSVRGLGGSARGAAIKVCDDASEAHLALSFSEPDGRFALSGLPANTRLCVYVLDCTMRKVLCVCPIRLSEGEVRTLDIGAATATAVFGRVTQSGKARPGELVSLDDALGHRTIVFTDSTGAFRLEGLPPGRTRIFINGDSVMSRRCFDLAVHEQRRLDFEFERRLTGTLVSADGQAMAPSDSATVVVARRVGEPMHHDEIEVDSEGRFELWCSAAGIYELGLAERHDEFVIDAPPRIDLRSRSNVSGIRLSLRQAPTDGRIIFRVIDAESGAAVQEGSYSVLTRSSSGAGLFEKGEIRELGLRPGAYRYSVTSSSHVPTKAQVSIEVGRSSVHRVLSLARSTAVRVESIQAGGRAFAAGLRIGDALTNYGVSRVRNVGELKQAIRSQAKSRSSIEIRFVRAGVTLTTRSNAGLLGITVTNQRLR